MKQNTPSSQTCLTQRPNQTIFVHLVPSASPQADEEARVTKAGWTTLGGIHCGLESVETQLYLCPHVKLACDLQKCRWTGVRSF